MSVDAGIEPRTAVTLALAVRRSDGNLQCPQNNNKIFRNRDRRPVAYTERLPAVHALRLAGGVLARPTGEGLRQG